MSFFSWIRLAAIFLFISGGCDGWNILVIFPFPGKSHFIMAEALAKALAERGHQITVISHFPQKTPLPNYKDISLHGTDKELVNNITVDYIFENLNFLPKTMDFIWSKAGLRNCEVVYNTGKVQQILKDKNEFHLVVTEAWGSDCFLPVANHLNVPHISLVTTMELPWSLGRYGVDTNPSYQVNNFLDYPPGKLTFTQRLINTMYVYSTKIGHYIRSELPSEKLSKKYLGPSTPDLSEVVRNSSLLLVNSHPSLTGPRPLPPNVIEVGGLHIVPAKPLPPELKTLLDNAKHGVILFSLGSLIRAETLGNRALEAIIEEIRTLPQIVLWKFGGTIPNKPENLKIMKWLPQRDILAHPNVKLFITHGGLMGTQEAVLCGVPMLGIPFFADQRFNVLNYQAKGFAIKVEVEEISREMMRGAIHELVHNPRYAENARHYSRLFSDRPKTALETAIYWTEYVIRHKGAVHMRSLAAQLSPFQYYLIDVFAFVSLSIVIIFIMLRVIFRTLFPRGKQKKN